MGYDMSIVNEPDTDAGYFRLNVFGMSRYRDYMQELGMIATGYARPGWPEIPTGLTDEDIEAAEAGVDGTDLPVKAAARAYVDQLAAHLAWRPEPATGIALHKFGSNDDWLVTPEEIAAALAAYRTRNGTEVREIVGKDSLDYWIKWISYLERAQVAGGFRVT